MQPFWSWLTTAWKFWAVFSAPFWALFKSDRIIAIATAVYAVVTFVMFRSIRSQACAAKRQADLMKEQVDINISKERPRISITPTDLHIGEEELRFYEAYFTVGCFCPTPAFVKSAVAETFVFSGSDGIPTMPIQIPARINVTCDYSVKAPILSMIGESTFKEIMGRKLTVRLKGCIEYRGVHLADNARSYITSFHYEWVVVDILGVSGFWEKCGSNEDNQET